MLGTLHPDEVDDLLHRHHVGHLACVAGGRPNVMPITDVHDTGALCGQTVPGRKLAALRANPVICFAGTDHPGAQAWRSVVAEGAYGGAGGPSTDGTHAAGPRRAGGSPRRGDHRLPAAPDQQARALAAQRVPALRARQGGPGRQAHIVTPL